MRDRRKGLDIVDNGRPAEQAFDGGEGGLEPRPTTLAFDCFEQSSLFAANICTCTAVQVALDRKVGRPAHQTLRAEDAHLIGFLDGLFHDLGLVSVLAPNKEEGCVQLAGPTRDGNAFKHLVRVVVNKQSIFECARLGFVTVDGEVAAAAINLW